VLASAGAGVKGLSILISGTSLSPLGQFQAGGETTVIAITDDDHGRC